MVLQKSQNLKRSPSQVFSTISPPSSLAQKRSLILTEWITYYQCSTSTIHKQFCYWAIYSFSDSLQFYVPPFLTCGTFKDHILESNLWLGGHGTQSLIHKDADNAINCLFNGEKSWIMISQDYEHLIPFTPTGGYSAMAQIDPDYVDLLKYPKFSEVPYTHVDMEAGDCLFIPASKYLIFKSLTL